MKKSSRMQNTSFQFYESPLPDLGFPLSPLTSPDGWKNMSILERLSCSTDGIKESLVYFLFTSQRFFFFFGKSLFMFCQSSTWFVNDCSSQHSSSVWCQFTVGAPLFSNWKYEICLIVMTLHQAAFDGNPVIANKREQTATCQQPNVTYVYSRYLLERLHCLLSLDFNYIFIPHSSFHQS